MSGVFFNCYFRFVLINKNIMQPYSEDNLLLLVSNKFEESLTTYDWVYIWQLVKDFDIKTTATDTVNSAAFQRGVAFKAMLLMNNWQLKDEAVDLLNSLPDSSADYLLHFARVYTYMIMADKDRVFYFSNYIPSSAPDWIKCWLELEYYGRSLQFKKQSQLLAKFVHKKSILPDYVMVAMLQTLNHDKANTYQFKKFINKHLISFDDSALSNAVQRLINIDLPYPAKGDASSIYQIAKGFEEKRDLKRALKAYDQLARIGYLSSLSLNPWMQLSLCSPWGITDFLSRADHAMQSAPALLEIQGRVVSRVLTYYWLKGDYTKLFSYLQKFSDFKDLPSTQANKVHQAYFNYIIKLCVIRQQQPLSYKLPDNAKTLHVIGESHCLSPNHRVFNVFGEKYKAQSYIVWGIKMFHLRNDKKPAGRKYHDVLFDSWMKCIPSDEPLMLTIGEIDLRPDEGVWRNSYYKRKPVKDVLYDTIDSYIKCLIVSLRNRTSLTIIQGIPAPIYRLDEDNCGDPKAFLSMIELANQYLKEQVVAQGWYFFDIYGATKDVSGTHGHGRYHLDKYHVKPEIYDGMESYLIS